MAPEVIELGLTDTPSDLAIPIEMGGSPPWAKALYQEVRGHRHQTNNALMVLGGEVSGLKGAVSSLDRKLGKEPNSDGEGGEGLIGDVRKSTREIGELKGLKKMGTGFLAAMSLTGALALAGVQQWLTAILKGNG